MAEKDYAIVCDETSDLPLSFLERAGVVPLRLDDARDAAGTLGRVYRDLAGRGFPQVISIHSAALFSPVVDGAKIAAEACADVCDVLVVDSGSASAATGMLVDRAARYRHLDVPAPEAAAALAELAAHVRLLVVPAASAPLSARRRRTPRAGLIGRAAASLRMRVTGERGLYLLARGELTQLARGNDPAALTGAHLAAVLEGSGLPAGSTERISARLLAASVACVDAGIFSSADALLRALLQDSGYCDDALFNVLGSIAN